MNLPDFARFFVRFYGATFAFWAVYDAIDLPPYIRNYSIVHEIPGADALAARDLATVVLKIGFQLLIALVLLVKTDQVISLFSKGLWTSEPIQPPQHNAGSRPSSDDSPGSETPSSLGPRG